MFFTSFSGTIHTFLFSISTFTSLRKPLTKAGIFSNCKASFTLLSMRSYVMSLYLSRSDDFFTPSKTDREKSIPICVGVFTPLNVNYLEDLNLFHSGLQSEMCLFISPEPLFFYLIGTCPVKCIFSFYLTGVANNILHNFWADFLLRIFLISRQ